MNKKWLTPDVNGHIHGNIVGDQKINLIMHNPYRLYNNKSHRKHFHYQLNGKHPAESTAFMTAIGFNKTQVPQFSSKLKGLIKYVSLYHVFSAHTVEVSHNESTTVS